MSRSRRPAASIGPDPNVLNNTQLKPVMRLSVAISGVDGAGIPEPVKVNSLTWQDLGTGVANADIASVQLYYDQDSTGTVTTGDLLLGSGAYSQTDGTVGISGAPLRIIPGATTEQWLMVYNFSGSGADGATFQSLLTPGNNSSNCTGLFSNATFSAIIGTAAPANTSTIVFSPDDGDATLFETTLPPATGTELDALTINTPLGQATLTATLVSPVGNTANTPDNVDTTVGVAETADQPVLSFTITDDATDGVGTNVTSIIVNGSGTGTDSTGLTQIRLFNEGATAVGTFQGTEAQLGAAGTFSQDNGTVTFSGSPLILIANGATATLLVVYDFSTTAPSTNVTFTSSISSAANIQGRTTANNPIKVVLPGSVAGGTRTVLQSGSGSSVPISLTIAAGAANPASANILGNAADVPVLQLALTAAASTNVQVTSITFRAQGTGHDKNDLTAVEIRFDRDADGVVDTFDNVITTGGSYDTDNGIITLTTSETISAGQTQNWLITYDLKPTVPALTPALTFQSLLSQTTDVVAVNASTGASVGVSITSAPIAGGSMSVVSTLSTSSILLTIEKGAESPSSSTISGSTTNMPMLQLSLEADPTVDVKVTALTIRGTGTGNDEDDLSGAKLIHDRDGDGILDATGDLEIATGTFSVDDGSIAFTGLDWIIPKGTTQTWLVTYDFNAPNVQPPLTFIASLEAAANVTAENATTTASLGVGVTGAPISGGTMTVGTVATVGGTPGGSSGTSATGDGGRAASSVVGGGGPVERGSSGGGGCYASTVSSSQPVLASLYVLLAGLLAGMLWSSARERERREAVKIRARE
ncbi:MAG: hypothetical protein HYY93_10580 [Planctomycetes bacterium]|nr:hypothetical protein [Planctomycetota bacterium]